MALEIERKYLVANDSFLPLATAQHRIAQGYLSTKPTVRVRVRDDEAFLTIKSATKSFTRHEWEYPIPVEDAREMLALCTAKIEKTRYIVPFHSHIWEVDVFEGRHKGLAIAEIELKSEDEPFDLPPFVGDDVTGIPAYYNSNLARL